jgi:outer membrane protein
MKKITRILFSTLLAVALPCIAYAQEAPTGKAWTLQECIDYALKNNITVKQNELNAELSQQNLVQSQANVLPSVNGNISHNYNFGRTIDPFTNQFATDRVLSQNFSLSSNVTIFSGLQQYNTIQQNKYSYLASKYDVDKIKNDVAMNVAMAYLQVLFSQELVEIARNQSQITVAQVERTQKLVDAGSLAKGSLYDIQAQLASEELSLANAQNQLDLSYLTLAQLLELTSMEGFSIVKPEINIPAETTLSASPGQIFTTALGIQPDIKSAEYKTISSKKSLAVARGGISPRIIFSGSIGTGYSGIAQRLAVPSAYTGTFDTVGVTTAGDFVLTPGISDPQFETTPFSDQVNDNFNQSFGVFVTIPIFNGLQTKTSISRAKISMESSQLSLQLAKNQLQKNIQQAYADANAALKKYAATEKTVQAMEESFKYMQQRSDVGMVNAVDYNVSKNNLTKARSELLQAKYDYVFKTKVLDFYQGKPLAF